MSDKKEIQIELLNSLIAGLKEENERLFLGRNQVKNDAARQYAKNEDIIYFLRITRQNIEGGKLRS